MAAFSADERVLTTLCGRSAYPKARIRIDDFDREVLKIEIGTSPPSRRIVRALDELIAIVGKPAPLASTMAQS